MVELIQKSSFLEHNISTLRLLLLRLFDMTMANTAGNASEGLQG
jgi:hypothetical protein